MKQALLFFPTLLFFCSCENPAAEKSQADSLVETRDAGLRVVSYYSDKSDTSTKTKELRYHKSGDKEEILFSNGKMNGEWKKWTAQGKLKESGNYKDNVEQGPVKFYNTDGVMQQEAVYAGGKKTGLTRSYYPTGELGMEQYAGADGKDTLHVYYHKNGKVNAKAWIRDGREYKSSTWYEDGKLWDEVVDQQFTEWYRNGQMKQQGKVNEMGRKDGVWKYWDEDGKARKDTAWVAGEKKL